MTIILGRLMVLETDSGYDSWHLLILEHELLIYPRATVSELAKPMQRQ